MHFYHMTTGVTCLLFLSCTADHVGQLHVLERAATMHAQDIESALSVLQKSVKVR